MVTGVVGTEFAPETSSLVGMTFLKTFWCVFRGRVP